ncbi:hypothetical protein E2C01_038092 [Portunus trituberculatus]|uniref:Uncharacterized protein n=1 Tax=Portunus trituberculatus TaxID=210409 RepID=A0A5B7FGP2_PORTR|nr:hypothetical protein [Portunus trituberculatus]
MCAGGGTQWWDGWGASLPQYSIRGSCVRTRRAALPFPPRTPLLTSSRRSSHTNRHQKLLSGNILAKCDSQWKCSVRGECPGSTQVKSEALPGCEVREWWPWPLAGCLAQGTLCYCCCCCWFTTTILLKVSAECCFPLASFALFSKQSEYFLAPNSRPSPPLALLGRISSTDATLWGKEMFLRWFGRDINFTLDVFLSKASQ